MKHAVDPDAYRITDKGRLLVNLWKEGILPERYCPPRECDPLMAEIIRLRAAIAKAEP